MVDPRVTVAAAALDATDPVVAFVVVGALCDEPHAAAMTAVAASTATQPIRRCGTGRRPRGDGSHGAAVEVFITTDYRRLPSIVHGHVETLDSSVHHHPWPRRALLPLLVGASAEPMTASSIDDVVISLRGAAPHLDGLARLSLPRDERRSDISLRAVNDWGASGVFTSDEHHMSQSCGDPRHIPLRSWAYAGLHQGSAVEWRLSSTAGAERVPWCDAGAGVRE